MMTQNEARGWLVIVGAPLLLLIWIVSVVPSEIWLAMAFLGGCLVIGCLLCLFIPHIEKMIREKKNPLLYLKENREKKRLEEQLRQEDARRQKEENERHYRQYLARGKKY